MELRVEPIERGLNVFDFSFALVVLAFAQSRSAKVESKHREAKAVQRLHRVEDDFVVQRPAKQGMRMTDDGSVGCIPSTGVEQGLQAPCGAVEKKRADRCTR